MSSISSVSTLYLCYFGLREPLVQTQVLPYLRRLSSEGIAVSLLTFEPDPDRLWQKNEMETWRARLSSEGIRWSSLTYHKRPSLLATLYDIAVGTWTAMRLLRRFRIDVLHARSHVAAMMGALTKLLCGGRLLFDIRGFMPEEYVDAGVWPSGGYLFRLTKIIEKRLMNAADGFVVLTEKARDILFPGCVDTDQLGRPIEVIPCCIDPHRFQIANTLSKEEIRKKLGLNDRRVLIYVGALDGWYLTNEMAEFLAVAHEQDASTFSIILTQSPTRLIAAHLRKLGVTDNNYLVCRVSPEEVPQYLKAADMALSFIKPCYSKLSSSPTKIAEYLAGGLPIICNTGIGDVDKVITADRTGVLVQDFNRASYLQALIAAEELLRDADLADRCRASAQQRFDLAEVGGVRYQRLYHRLLGEDMGDLFISQAIS